MDTLSTLLESFSDFNYPLSQWIALIFFTITMTGTPGPNNVMLTSSGANFGYKRSIAHILGIHVGLFSMFILMSLGLFTLFEKYPITQKVMFYIGATYLVYLAYKIATTPIKAINNEASLSEKAKPLTLLQAAAFQYVNPKAWVMVSNGIIFYAITGENFAASILVIMATFFIFGFMVNSTWVMFGRLIATLLKTPKAWRVFNVIMALLLLLCLPLML